MKYIDQARRVAAAQLLRQAETETGVRVVSAAIRHSMPQEQSHHGSPFTMAVAFVREPTAYLGIDHSTSIGNGVRDSGIDGLHMYAMDVRDAFAQASNSPGSMGMAALSLYVDAVQGESIVRTQWADNVASELSNVGPQTRNAMMASTRNFIDGAMQMIRAGVPAVEGNGAPAFNAQAAANQAFVPPWQRQPAEQAFDQSASRAIYGKRLAATMLAIKATLADGNLPSPDALDFPVSLRNENVPALREMLASPCDLEFLEALDARVSQFTREREVRQANPIMAFGAVEAPRPEPETPRNWAAAINQGLAQMIQTAVPAMTDEHCNAIANNVVRDGQVIEAGATPVEPRGAIQSSVQNQPAPPTQQWGMNG